MAKKKMDDLKPIRRSDLRLKLGKTYYSFRRYMKWATCWSFAKKRESKPLENLCFQHKTILLRELKDFDMHYQRNKIINLRIAVEGMNGILLHPGETFSYWKLIGKPGYKKGYVDGMILKEGQVTIGVGGGLCQLSNLIFWMALHTPLTITERHRHGYDVFPDSNRTQPFGSGATCFYPYRDLMLHNGTDRIYQLCLHVGEKYLEGEWRSDQPQKYRYEILEKNHLMRNEFWGGYSRHNELYRRVLDEDNRCIKEEFVAENHALMMYQPFLSEPII